ncbi:MULTISPECIES: UDP-glucose/GDP-mannose dehydrogenase family protein [Bacillus]|uniref:UDP-glucose 6-dehydrogenase n=2 Tax=Bacillus cereus group TaxID=86661 RepID=A0A150B1Y7_BACCE|nr:MULTISPECIES: UDP-glucose/GDP-mannose dehydrogenase family protein [Bacillus]KLA17444.1 UDP-glucose dehydrogenase [Bacillus cereus]KMP63660.1 UDP-glucose 6-dehydrogenase [Bacillus cereus]KXX93926.1 UDP-glucose 6-dehydrogenase [Bacillus cereus]MCG3790422.1 UDP-glucose/GDP-mannose dehydrogenase family protein [Bacillus sp. UTDS19-33BHI26]MDG1597672.1 UDP-glucose/GDP-mannose dehydrogenase family protein [Bacillus cereus]
MNIAVIGTGYVGLVTGVCLSEINHNVICVDTDIEKIKRMRKGISPIYEPGLDELMQKNIEKGTLHFTNNHQEAFKDVDVIFIAVGTPQLPNGSANLQYVEDVAKAIGTYVTNDTVVVTKSTVPVGTNKAIEKLILDNLKNNVVIKIASNPEFLREGSAIYDTFHGDRIVIGVEDNETADILIEMYKPLNMSVFKTDIHSSEMIKYASNAFLATKISFINEISNICEKLGANVEDVAQGMGLDNRIGTSFLRAGIGYGGSCFPKDTHALVQIAGGVEYDFKLLKSVIEVNNNQHIGIINKVKERIGSLVNKRIAILGLAFKPNTDDMRESPAIMITQVLDKLGAKIFAYDPIAMENAKPLLPGNVKYTETCEEALTKADLAIIITDWDEFKSIDLSKLEGVMDNPLIFDGRNCFSLEAIENTSIEYHSIGRPVVNPQLIGIR